MEETSASPPPRQCCCPEPTWTAILVCCRIAGRRALEQIWSLPWKFPTGSSPGHQRASSEISSSAELPRSFFGGEHSFCCPSCRARRREQGYSAHHHLSDKLWPWTGRWRPSAFPAAWRCRIPPKPLVRSEPLPTFCYGEALWGTWNRMLAVAAIRRQRPTTRSGLPCG